MIGHCHCGAVGFQTDGPVAWSAYCHCADCRRNCAAPVAAFFGVPHGSVTWSGTPAIYASSSGVERLFCGDCGTPMAYRAASDQVNIHLYNATLDDPNLVAPTFHVFSHAQISWLSLSDTLPRYERTRA